MDQQKELTLNDRRRRSEVKLCKHTRNLAPANMKKGKVSELPRSKVETQINSSENNMKEREDKGRKFSWLKGNLRRMVVNASGGHSLLRTTEIL